MLGLCHIAISCNILQSSEVERSLAGVGLMRVFAAYCNSLQQSEKWTQNPPIARSWGFDPPSRHHKINELSIAGIFGCLFLCPNYDQTPVSTLWNKPTEILNLADFL
jgi:hypothetical protein